MIDKNTYTWEKIYAVHKSKVIKGIAIWFIIIPIIIKVITVEKVKAYIPPDFSLPFSWPFFYVGATVFFISSVLYTLRCPEIISKYSGFDDYMAKNQSRYYLKILTLKTLKDREERFTLTRKMIHNNFLGISGTFQDKFFKKT